ncbi:MAG: hypothetical protein ACLFRD_07355 [Nitriliruptoraceae bacterium]
MSSALERPSAPPQRPRRVPTSAKRVGYLAAAVINGVLLWVAHQLLGWGWPGFLTDDFEQVLGILTASFVASILANLALAAHHRGRFRAFADLVTAGFALAVGVRLWEVFPIDFTGYATDWSGVVRVALGVGIAATGIAIVANLVKLLTGSDGDA